MRMNSYLLGVFFVLLCVAATHAQSVESQLETTPIQQELVVFETFEAFAKTYLENVPTDRTRVINLWATWCSPCLKELPYFEELNAQTSDRDVEIVLVSIDLKRVLDSKLKPFLAEKNFKSTVVALTDGNANAWIDKIDPSWSGAIPITLFVRGDQRAFYEKEYHNLAELQADLTSFNNKL